MSSQRQIQANRRNAQKSTGPTSAQGKAVSSLNALKTGINAKSLTLPSESQEDLETLTQDFYHQHQPATPDARAFVDELIYCEWILRRLRNAETEMWRYQSENMYRDPMEFPLGQPASGNASTFARIQYRIDATRRARDRALKSLKELPPSGTDETGMDSHSPEPTPTATPQTTSPQIGFVPPTTSPAQPEPAPATPPGQPGS